MKKEFNTTTSVQFLKSVGPARARNLARLGIETVGDLLQHYPRRYFDRSHSLPVAQVRPGQEVTVQGEILTVGERATGRGRTVQTISIGDDTGVLFCVWFNQRFLLKQFRSGRRIMISGLAQQFRGRLQVAGGADGAADPAAASLHTGRMVPVYGLTGGIGQHWLRALVHQALEKLPSSRQDALPADLRRRRGLLTWDEAVRAVHFPANQQALAGALKRLKYQEGFLVQTLMARRRNGYGRRQGLMLSKPGDLTRDLVRSLPFALTGAQRRVLAEILADLRSGRVMHRLVQGDVGCGKTLVAFIACLFVIEQGYQALLMAPTEVLARQHGQSLARLAEPLQVNVATLTGSTPAAERRAVLAALADREIDLLVGTNAVIQDGVYVPDLGLSVVDEQHRFGVRQRGLSGRGGQDERQSHVLVMSATPIPRSLALTLYGDLDLSVIDALPGGRQPIRTDIVPERDEARVWEHCRAEVAAGRQVYVVHPVIEETAGQDLKAATAEFERLRGEIFADRNVALLHGRLKAREKAAVMEAFNRGEVSVLVATTVVEVGLDVPRATVMVIHNPERFGLAQLHQLRGRIGRGEHASRCFLVCDGHLAGESRERIRFFASHLDGFALAEQDLRVRGPGEAWGVRQSGLPGFRLLNPVTDADLIRLCREDSRAFLERDPDLDSPAGRRLGVLLEQVFGSVAGTMAG